MIETIITLCVLGTAAVVCIIALVVIHYREKKMKKKNPHITVQLGIGCQEKGDEIK